MIRQMTTDDVFESMELRLSVRENVLSDPARVTADMVKEAITQTGRGWAFTNGGQMLGFSIALQDPPAIWALFVLPGHEGKGIGNKLHDQAVEWLWELGAARITLTTDPGTRADRFYRARGWVDTGLNQNGEICFELVRDFQ